MKKLICLLVCVILMIPMLSSCSKPPEYAEIDGRFRELVEASAEINQIFFGEGLPTYERVYDPRSTTQVYREKVTDENGAESEKLYYYYEINDKTYGRVIAYRSGYTVPFSYVQVLHEADADRTPVYQNSSQKAYAYIIENYVEPEYELFYDKDDPEDYDYVRHDAKYGSVNEIKAAAEKVYSSDYLESIYGSMFIGTVSSGSVGALSARYIEYADDEGNISLMKSNTFKPLIKETRQFDFSTARIGRNSNAKFVNVEVETYLESKPEERLTVRISMILQDGVWMLDSATY